MLTDLVGNHLAFLSGEYIAPVNFFTNDHRCGNMAGVEHFRQLNANQPASYYHRPVDSFCCLLHQLEILETVKALNPVKILAGPSEFVGFGTGGQHEFIVMHLFVIVKQHVFPIGINILDKGTHQVDAVFLPEPILIRFGVFIGQIAHVDIHEGCPRIEVVGFR